MGFGKVLLCSTLNITGCHDWLLNSRLMAECVAYDRTTHPFLPTSEDFVACSRKHLKIVLTLMWKLMSHISLLLTVWGV